MKSKIYPSILFVQNSSQSFVSKIQSNKNIQIMHPKCEQIQHYAKSVKKIFNQIQVFPQTLWVCSIKSTPYVKVYFAEPLIYPQSECCQQSVYVLFNSPVNGSIICPGCQKKLSQFVYSQTSGLDVHDKQIFKQKVQQSKNVNSEIREIFSSQKFRTKNMKKLFDKLQQQRKQFSKTGGFILQIPTNIKSQYLKQNMGQNCKDILNGHILLPQQQESKRIIQQIFS